MGRLGKNLIIEALRWGLVELRREEIRGLKRREEICEGALV